MKYLKAIISSKRQHQVPAMQKLAGNDCFWFVGAGESANYFSEGAVNVVESGGLCQSRNAALNMAFEIGIPCLQLSDDAKKIKRAHSKKDSQEISLNDAVSEMEMVCSAYGVKLCGVAPTSNLFYFNPEKPYKNKGFVVGDMIYVKPSPERFDENLRLKEDYDFTLQHMISYGKIARLDNIMAEFAHRTNKGGAVAYRTSDLEKQSIAYLKKKWGKFIVNNPRRPDEILLKFS
jgi:hypothetical protein